MPPERRSLEDVVRVAEDVFRTNGVDHVFVGAISVMAFGRIRTTEDIDVIADLAPSHVDRVCEAFRREGFLASPDDLRAAIAEGGHCAIEDVSSLYRIDLVPVNSAAKREALATRVRLDVLGLSLPVAGPEHTIIMKLSWGREQDIDDAKAIGVRQRGKLDLERMRAFARREGMSAKLEAFLREVEGEE
ncbi:MAG: DUF6036 family nucleotidyltransferase [Candidatus Thermoplasmatota archaeon]